MELGIVFKLLNLHVTEDEMLWAYISFTSDGIFLLIQLVSVISFITWLNDCCVLEWFLLHLLLLMMYNASCMILLGFFCLILL